MSDPMIQVLLALCEHPVYVAGCGDCETRRAEVAAHLVAMVDALQAELGGDQP